MILCRCLSGELRRQLKHHGKILQVVQGAAMTVQAPNSDVILLVPPGIHGVILGTIHTDHSSFAHLAHEWECIVSPICEFQVVDLSETPQQEYFRLQVPHIIQDIKAARDKIRVQLLSNDDEDTKNAKNLLGLQKAAEDNQVKFSVVGKYVEIFTRHFSRIVVSAEGIDHCCRQVKMLVFSKLIPPMVKRPKPRANAVVFFTSSFAEISDYLQVRFYTPGGHDPGFGSGNLHQATI